MKNAGAIAVLLLVAFGICQAQSSNPLSISIENVQRVEILYYPEHIMVRAALTPERLEQLYKYKMEVRDLRQSAEGARLVTLLRQTSVKTTGHSYDHRTAVLLFDSKGNRIASLYFDKFGSGTIDGRSGNISGGVYEWTKSLLKGIAE